MIITKNAVYLHVPKTAGIWMREVLKPVAIEERAHAIPDREILKKYKHIFGFVRNPWSWYVSLYSYITKGSNIHNPTFPVDPLFVAFGHTPTFEEFVTTLVEPPNIYKKKLYVLAQMSDLKISSMENFNPSNKIKDMITPWMTKDIGYYELVLENFLSNATKIGQYENIKSDLLDMLIASNDITEDLKISINQTPATNTATEIVEYQTFYNLKLQTLVHNASKELITKFNYTF